MSENRERDISRLLGPGWAKKFEGFLTDLAPVGPATSRKYLAVVKSLLGNRLLFSMDDSIRMIKRKNRVYVRAAIVKFLEFLEHEKVLGEDQAVVWIAKLPAVKEPPAKPREIPTVDEVYQVIEKLEREEQRIARFMFATGCRVHEALGVKLRDVDFKTGRVILYGKGRLQKKPRPTKLPLDFCAELQKAAKADGILDNETIFWPNSKASLESKVDIFNRKLKITCEAVLGRSTGSHDFRRVFATKLLEKTGGNLQLVQRMLGHEKIETTLKYTQYMDRERDLNTTRDIMENISKDSKTAHRKL
ncbi:MAG: site-specific integrase [Candidatus Aenigmarchaeota archaeon]|nr:site-specific integrase [Candidatus Aenigmarchaeota archaeon]